ncbi:MAG: hypothetical protein JWR16_1840 [Nevskia sp.]|nr:hypothetical protein [Nevskia sp.]
MTETTKQKNAINAAIDLFHRRYVLRILWELRADSFTFRELQQACNDISPSTLNLRLGDLRAANLVTHASGAGYALSDQGQELLLAAAPVLDWAVDWHSSSGKPRRKATVKAKARSGRSTPQKKKRPAR